MHFRKSRSALEVLADRMPAFRLLEGDSCLLKIPYMLHLHILASCFKSFMALARIIELGWENRGMGGGVGVKHLGFGVLG